MLNAKDKHGSTVLKYSHNKDVKDILEAALAASTNAASKPLEKGAKLSATDKDGSITALAASAHAASKPLEKGAKLSATDKDGP